MPQETRQQPVEVQRRLTMAVAVPDTLDREKRTFQAVAYDHTMADRHNSVIRPSAWGKRLDLFRQNPVGLWAHNFCDVKAPIFSCENITVDESKGLLFWPRWQAAGIDPFADMVFNKYAADPPLLRGFSVGFMPYDWVEPDAIPDSMRALMTEAEKSADIVYTDVELHEISAVPVPSSRGSLARDFSGNVRLDSSIIMAIERMGFVQQARLAVNPNGSTLAAEISRDELVETIDTFSARLIATPRTSLAQAEVARLENTYKRLSDYFGNPGSVELQEAYSLLDKAGKTIRDLRSLNDQLVGASLERLVRA